MLSVCPPSHTQPRRVAMAIRHRLANGIVDDFAQLISGRHLRLGAVVLDDQPGLECLALHRIGLIVSVALDCDKRNAFLIQEQLAAIDQSGKQSRG